MLQILQLLSFQNPYSEHSFVKKMPRSDKFKNEEPKKPKNKEYNEEQLTWECWMYSSSNPSLYASLLTLTTTMLLLLTLFLFLTTYKLEYGLLDPLMSNPLLVVVVVSIFLVEAFDHLLESLICGCC